MALFSVLLLYGLVEYSLMYSAFEVMRDYCHTAKFWGVVGTLLVVVFKFYCICMESC